MRGTIPVSDLRPGDVFTQDIDFGYVFTVLDNRSDDSGGLYTRLLRFKHGQSMEVISFHRRMTDMMTYPEVWFHSDQT